MRSVLTLELDENEIEALNKGNDVLIEMPTFAKEDDRRGGLFRKLDVDIVIRRQP